MSVPDETIFLDGDQIVTGTALPSTGTRSDGSALTTDDIRFQTTWARPRRMRVIGNPNVGGYVDARDEDTGEVLSVPPYMIERRLTDPERHREAAARVSAELGVAWRGALPGAAIGAVVGGPIGAAIGGGISWALYRGALYLAS